MFDLFSLKKQFYLLVKNKLFVILYLIMLISTITPLAFFIIMGADVVYTFYIIVRFIFFESLIFMILSYLFLIMDRKSKIGETLQVITHNSKKYMKNSIMTLSFLLLLYNLLLIIILVINAFITGEFSVFFMLMGREYLLNVLLPQVVYFMITIMLSQLNHFKLSSILFIVITILLSPLPTKIEFYIKPVIPIDTVIHYIQLPFALFLQYSEYSVDYLYGFQNELYKIVAFVFWVVLTLIVLNKDYLRKSKIKLLSCSVLTCICFGLIYYPQDIYRTDNRWNGSFSDFNYYDINNHKSYVNVDEKCSEHIKNYNLKVSMKNQLNVKGSIDISLSEKKDECVLTLYRNYKVKELSSPHLKSYRQEGDYIYIEFNEAISYEKINISYAGYHNIAFANYQATQLPGYFPWYPMEGKKNVYFNNADIIMVNYGLNPYNRIKGANFYIDIDARYPVISNLEEKDNNIFEGYSDSLTLLGGNVEKVPTKQETSYQVVNYFPYRINHSFTLDDYLKTIKESIENVKRDFKNVYKQDLDIFDNKKIIICSNALYRNQQNGQYAEFDDYIIMSEKQYTDIMYFVNYHLQYRTDVHPCIIEILPWIDQFNSNDMIVLSELMNTLQSRAKSFETSENKDNEQEFKKIRENYLGCIEIMEEYIENYGEEGTMKKLGEIILGGRP